VTRRHPDIKWIRRETDIKRFSVAQQRLLSATWNSLQVGGKLLYVTCSVFREENQDVIAAFIAAEPSARRLALSQPLARGIGHPVGQNAHIDQIDEALLLPDEVHDGFYFALLEKVALKLDVAAA
jgi:16S rRNA (cytosine967-C5)-methyltransferase